jgi:ribonuclease HII
VVAAAVILPADADALASLLGRVDDSKRLTPVEREQLYGVIRQHALSVSSAGVPADEIDRMGILAANRRALAQALMSLTPPADYALLDFLTLPDLPLPQRSLAYGDAISLSIAAASIIAKVTRDRWMAQQDAVYPGYGFARHKGYGTAEHRAALARLGPCALHRMSFAPVGKTADRSVAKPRTSLKK